MGLWLPRAGMYTARDVAASAAGASGAGSAVRGVPAGGKHATAHLRDQFTRRDLFGTVRGKCNAVRSAGGSAARRR